MHFALISFSGLTHIEITVGALIEIIHAFASTDLDNVGLATKLYVQLLNCEVSTCIYVQVKYLTVLANKKMDFFDISSYIYGISLGNEKRVANLIMCPLGRLETGFITLDFNARSFTALVIQIEAFYI